MTSSPASSLDVIILAAGKGKRMHSDIPKVLHKVGGRSLLAHVVDTALSLKASAVHVVVGHEAEQIRAAFEDAPVTWALQAEQLGTGHAVAQAMPNVRDDGLVLVLYGDVPLIKADTLRQLLARSGDGALAVLTLNSSNPY